MPTININHSSPLTAEETFKKVKKLLSHKEEFKKFDNNIQYQFDDLKMTGEIKGSQFKAKLNVKNSGNKSLVSITIDIPFLLMAFKNQVKSSIEKQLNQLLSQSG